MRAWTSTLCTWFGRVPPKGEPRSEELEALLQDFIGIVRGRTATSERGSETRQARAERIAAERQRKKSEGTSRQRPPRSTR